MHLNFALWTFHLATLSGSHNQRQEIECLNAAIAAINKGSRVNYLNLHLQGIRIDPESGKRIYRLRPEKQIWREADVRKRLHFTPSCKVKIANRAARLLQRGLTNDHHWSLEQGVGW